MHWKQKLGTLEKQKKWDAAIELMIHVIDENSGSIDPYIYMNYLLMNLLVEEDYDNDKYSYYKLLIKKYFDESYAKFSDNAEYLFFTASTALMSEWHFDIDVKDYDAMFKKALVLEPDNLLYQDYYYTMLDKTIPSNKKAAVEYAKKILEPKSSIQIILNSKGAIGERLLGLMTNWSLRILGMKP